MECRVLGTVQVVADGDPLPLGPPKQRAIFALLLIHAGELVTLDRIIDEIWGAHPPKSARHAVHVYISDLRSRLNRCDEMAIVTRGPGYQLEVPAAAVDVHLMEEAVLAAEDLIEAADYEEAATLLESALELWHGPPYADFIYEDFAASEIRRIEDLRLQAIELSIEAEVAQGFGSDVVGLLGTLTSEYPERERFWLLLIRALEQSGRTVEALRACEAAASYLRTEVGIAPPPDLVAAHDAIVESRPAVERALSEH